MTVYVDDMRAPFRRMIMCHMMADSTEELLLMVDKIGVARKWIQDEGHPVHEHFDISLTKRALAVEAGAVEITYPHGLGLLLRERKQRATMEDNALSMFGGLIMQLRNISSKTEKMALVKAAVVNTDTFLARLWMWTLNPYITFGVTKIEQAPKVAFSGVYLNDRSGLVQLIDDLSTRRLSGHAAHAAVSAYYKQLDENAAVGFRALITRDPKCGVKVSTLNKIWSGWVPVFLVQRARPWDEEHVADLISPGRAIAEAKLDGFRRIYINHPAKRSQLLTKTGQDDPSFDYIVDYLDAITQPGTVLDGELVYEHGLLGSRQALSRLVGSTIRNSADCGARLMIFDVMTYEDWTTGGGTDIAQWHRTMWLNCLEHPINADAPACRIYREIVMDVQHFDDFYTRLLEMGYEGAILKHIAGHYVQRSSPSKHWMKRKDEFTEEVQILDVLPGDPGTKYEFTFGRFFCRRENGIDIMVGRGLMKENEVHETWARRDDLPGKIIEIMHNGETEIGSVWHSRWYAWRDDKVTI